MLELNPPKGLGFIVRTAGADRMKKELARDMTYLMRLWKNIAKRVKRIPGPVAIYEESDMIIRTIRDIFSTEFDTVLIDDPAAFERARDFVQQVMPKCADRIQLYEGKEPIFHKFNLDKEIEKIQKRIVPLPQGGSIVIDQAEALVAIDVNSGNFRADDNAEETAYRMNLQAAKEIARQLRLRDLGGVIVNDFIDMRKDKHRRDVERALRDAVKRDRAKTKILRTSPFGLIEMTRQRIRPSVGRSTFQECPYCHDTGSVKSVDNMALDVLRTLILASEADAIRSVEVEVETAVADCLNNKMRDKIIELEKTGDIQVQIRSRFGVSPEYSDIRYFNDAGQEVFIKNN
ncbi:MAG: ribonuclease E/G, partial [Thermoguttaceae bacterium]|nr:ribonuclease E/G [Thermoguttaceae bacterium]